MSQRLQGLNSHPAKMSTLISDLDGDQIRALGPQTPAQWFLVAYATVVNVGGYNDPASSGLRFYAPSVKYHNTNGVVYYGGEQMWDWMKELFEPFEKMEHPLHHILEISRPDGTAFLNFRCTRKIWLKNTSDKGKERKADVEAPMFWSCTIGPAEGEGQGEGGLQFKEVHLFWDTGPLLSQGLLKEDAVAFRMDNPYGMPI